MLKARIGSKRVEDRPAPTMNAADKLAARQSLRLGVEYASQFVGDGGHAKLLASSPEGRASSLLRTVSGSIGASRRNAASTSAGKHSGTSQ